MQSLKCQTDLLLHFMPLFTDAPHPPIVPLSDVTRGAIKSAADRIVNDSDFKRMTILNGIARQLGFTAWTAYLNNCPSLKKFMTRHGLQRRADLIRSRFDRPFVNFDPRQVADRLFLSGRPLPEKIFTGYNIDWVEMGERPLRMAPRRFLSFKVVMDAVRRADQAEPGAGADILGAAVDACDLTIMQAISNLLGDQLVRYPGDSVENFQFVPNIYPTKDTSDTSLNEDIAAYREVAMIFREWMERSNDGWVKVVRYHEKLVFLVGPNGEYDFVFPDLRNEGFNRDQYLPYLKNCNVPKSNDAYHYKRWQYFEFRGWLEEDRHLSKFPAFASIQVGEQQPNDEAWLKRYFMGKGVYRWLGKAAPLCEGYCAVMVGGQALHVSNLITISQFREFLKANHCDYAKDSREPNNVDLFDPVNNDENQNLPVTVTWFDAMAYASWISQTTGLPVRLLTEQEYLSIARFNSQSDPDVPAENPGENCEFIGLDGQQIGGNPHEASEPIKTLQFSFIESAIQTKIKRTPAGLEFLVSADFGEWLNEMGAAINTSSHESLLHPGRTAVQWPIQPTSTGKYKSRKVGFRLCYLGQSLVGEPPKS